MRYESLPSGQTGQGEEGDACLCGYGHFGHTAFSAICWNGGTPSPPTRTGRPGSAFCCCPCAGVRAGGLAVLALPESLSGSFWSLALWGGLAATAVEYAVHVLYDRLLGVRFWDYSQVRWNLRGRICLPFSLAWSCWWQSTPPLPHPQGAGAGEGPPGGRYRQRHRHLL